MGRSTDVKDQVAREFKRRGLKITRQREIIAEQFLKTDHVTVEGLHGSVRKLDPRIGQVTVYRTLKQLCGMGLARERHFQEGRTLYDNVSRKKHHDHLICTRCGRIIEFSDEAIERLQKKVARRHGFQITGHRLEISGTCSECQEERSSV